MLPAHKEEKGGFTVYLSPAGLANVGPWIEKADCLDAFYEYQILGCVYNRWSDIPNSKTRSKF